MFSRKENILYFITTILLLIVDVVLGVSCGINVLFIAATMVMLMVVFILGVVNNNNVYKRIEKLRLNLDNNIKEGIDPYTEDELGRLSMKVKELLFRYDELNEKRLAEKEYLKDVIADMSHQIKTPVAALTVFNDLLDEGVEDEELHNMILQSQHQLEKITWLLKAMLQLARIDAGSVVFQKKPTNMLEYLQGSAAMVSTRAMEKAVEIKISGDACTCDIDPEWFQEAIINVIKNAIDYSPSGSEVKVTVSNTPIATKIMVMDSGNGIASKDKINVFKRFYRSDSASSNPNSVGIGLSLSKSIIEKMGGRIWIESRHISECKDNEVPYTHVNILL